MKKLSAISALITTGITYLFVTNKALAVTVDPCPKSGGGNFDLLCKIQLEGQGGLLQTLITIAFIVATLIALAFLIFGGIKWIMSGGDKAGVEGARNMIVAALVGLVIVFLSYLLLNIVFSFFGLSFGDFTFPALGLQTGTGGTEQN